MPARRIYVSGHVVDRHAAAIATAAPDFELIVIRDGVCEAGPEIAQTAEVAFFSADVYPDHARSFIKTLLPNDSLRWLHSFSAGIDDKFFRSLAESGVTVTPSAGANAPAVAQLAVLLMLSLAREFPNRVRAQDRGEWQRCHGDDLDGAQVFVIGMGAIGDRIARTAVAMGAVVTGFRRSPRGNEPCVCLPMGELNRQIGDADYVVCALPLTDATRGMIDARTFEGMKPGARIVNVGRGETVDEAAMVEALASGRLGGAGLDVFAVEPLPADSPLWSMDNVIVSPHAGGNTQASYERAEMIFLDYLARYAAGEALPGV